MGVGECGVGVGEVGEDGVGGGGWNCGGFVCVYGLVGVGGWREYGGELGEVV